MTTITTTQALTATPGPRFRDLPELPAAPEHAEQEIRQYVRHQVIDAVRQCGLTAALLTPLGLPVTLALTTGDVVAGLFAVSVLMAGAAVAGLVWSEARVASRTVTVPAEAAAQLELIELANESGAGGAR